MMLAHGEYAMNRMLQGLVLSFAVGTISAQVPDAAQKSFADGGKYEQGKQLSAAMDSYHTALKASGGHCLPCLDALARVQMNMELYKDSAGTAAQLAAQSPDTKAKAEAEFREGLAWFRLYFAQTEGEGAIDKDPKHAANSLKQAEAALKQGETDDPGDEVVRMLHGHVLAEMKHDEEASREFTACAVASGTSPEECARAQRFAKDVSLARGEPVPAFEAKTMDGKTVSLDSLAGKVVLVDFWATWCTYCKRDSDYIQSMLDSFDDGRFVLLEVNVDESEAAWKHYVEDERLHGVQTRDDSKELRSLFHVSGYPTYVIFDGDGIVRERAVGIEGDLRGTVRKLLVTAPAVPADARTLLPKPAAE
jgi:thiol-disulfide isomerase/thioredoxin